MDDKNLIKDSFQQDNIEPNVEIKVFSVKREMVSHKKFIRQCPEDFIRDTNKYFPWIKKRATMELWKNNIESESR